MSRREGRLAGPDHGRRRRAQIAAAAFILGYGSPQRREQVPLAQRRSRASVDGHPSSNDGAETTGIYTAVPSAVVEEIRFDPKSKSTAPATGTRRGPEARWYEEPPSQAEWPEVNPKAYAKQYLKTRWTPVAQVVDSMKKRRSAQQPKGDPAKPKMLRRR